MDGYLKVTEAAAKARVSATVIRRWYRTGGLPWVNIGEGKYRPRIRIPESDLDAFLVARKRQAA